MVYHTLMFEKQIIKFDKKKWSGEVTSLISNGVRITNKKDSNLDYGSGQNENSNFRLFVLKHQIIQDHPIKPLNAKLKA